MKRDISLWQLGGFGITAVGGTLLHFLYDWTGEALLCAPFSGVNESTWEHMKLLYFPMAAFALVQRHYFRERTDFWTVKLCGISLGLVLIPVIFYTYNGAIGKSPDWLNIGIYFASAAGAFLWENRLFRKDIPTVRRQWPSAAAIALVGLLFVIFTFVPPHLPVFRDPLTGGYGRKI
ncbi:MAG: hypothetical protein IJC53_02490 [Clostridia bacterium]|nr:hypothetical protein [Clostridia bacterium]